MTQITPRPLQRLTPLDNSVEIIIAAADNPEGISAATELHEALRNLGANARVEANPSFDILTAPKGPVFLIGNLSNSDCVRELYFRFFCSTDCTYPGPEGYEVRTLMDPLGTGHNIIHIGYSDNQGLNKGLAYLLDVIENPLPFLSKIKATQIPLPDHYAEMIRKKQLPDKPELEWEVESHDGYTHKGFLAYLTGEVDLLKSSHEVWRAILRYGAPEGDFNIRDLHLRMSHILASYRLLECVGMIEEDLRQPFLQFILDWIHGDQGISKTNIPLYTAPDHPRQNHGLIPGLALAYFADYCERHHPEIKEWKDWKSVAESIFQPYNNGSWKPLCGGLCHGWFLSQPPMIDYALLEPEHKFFASGGVRRAGECAIAIVNNQGWMPSSGDGTILRTFPGPSLRAAAAWHRDGRYTFVHNLTDTYRSLRSQVFLPRSFDVGVEPEVPVDSIGLTVIEMDPLVYGTFEKNPELANEDFGTPPGIPLISCFDKLVFRAGWERQDAYLMFHGVGNGSHAYADTLDVLDYSRHGFSFIVSDTGCYYPETENHSVLTIMRDGVSGTVPSFAELLESSYDAHRGGYARMRLNNYNGADWIREVFFFPEIGVIFHDTVRANQSGSYVLENHLRIPGKVNFRDDKLSAKRSIENESYIHFQLSGTCSHPHSINVKEQSKSLQFDRKQPGPAKPPEENTSILWRKRYGIDDKIISVLTTRSVVELEPEEALSFTHFAQIRSEDESEYHLTSVDGTKITLSGSKEIEVISHEKPSTQKQKVLPSDQEVVKPRQVDIEKLAELQGTTTAMTSGLSRGTYCGDQDGLLTSHNNSFTKEWEVLLEGPIHAISVSIEPDGETCFVGHGKSSLSAIINGNIIWTHQINGIPSYSYWWELWHPSAVAVKAAKTHEGTIIYVGCGDKIFRGFDAKGNEKWVFRYDNGVPAQIFPIDLDFDGNTEVLVGGEMISNQSTCRILTPSGELISEIPIEGWTSRMTAVTAEWTGNSWLWAFGANRANNLHLYEIEVSKSEAITLKINQHFINRLAGEVKGVSIDLERQSIYAATSQGYLLGLDFSGNTLWHTEFSHPIDRFEKLSENLLVVDSIGKASITDPSGKTLAEAISPKPWDAGFVTDNTAVFASDHQLLRFGL
jgi:hypothetical protein